MNTTNDLYRKRQGMSPTACAPKPAPCGTCGQLECLCRPRFFAGQILTADDLNRLDSYVRGKQRLHNRQLHGWGVVNGLEVTCNPCGGGVAVGCGYALSPCGDDIVVCEPVTVDVCDLIRRCKEAERQWQPCQVPGQTGTANCPGGEEEWILAIRYAESPARGVKPLRPTEDCGCASSAKPRGAPVQCEPTVVCEGFAFEVYPKPPDPLTDPGQNDPAWLAAFNPQSELYQRFLCCWSLLVTQMPRLPGGFSLTAIQANPQAWYQWMIQARAQLGRYLATHGSTNCVLLEAFNAIPYPTAGTTQNAGAIALAVVLLLLVWVDAMLTCLCSALLPPCPAPSQEVRVPIASLHVGGQPCRVLRVCNWSVYRKMAVSFPSLQYWLSLLPIGVALRRGLETLCCLDLTAVFQPRDSAGTSPFVSSGNVAAVVQPRAAMASAPGGASAVTEPAAAGAGTTGAGENQDPNLVLAAAAYQRGNVALNPSTDQPVRLRGAVELLTKALARTGETLELSTLVDSLLLSADKQGESQQARLSQAETANLPQFLIANQLIRPLAAGALSQGHLGPLMELMVAQVLDSGAAATRAPAESRTQTDSDALRAEIEALKAGLAAQAKEIARLKPRAR